MRNMVSLRSTRRQPFRTFLLLLLCTGLSFAFLSQVLQYQVIQTAISDSASYYHAVGVPQPVNIADEKGQEDVSPCLSILGESAYVDYVNTNMRRLGVMHDIYNVDLDGQGDLYNWNMLYLQGTFKSVAQGTEQVLSMYAQDYLYRDIIYITFDITDIFSGQPERASLGEMTFRMDVTGHKDFRDQLEAELQPESSYFFCANWKKYYYNAFPSIKAVNTIVPLGTVNASVFDTNAYLTGDTSKFPHPIAEGKLEDYFYPVPAGESVDFTEPALSAAAKGLEYVNSNEHGVSVIPVKNMGTLPYFEENYFLSEGRLLTRDDDIQQNHVCVIRQELADGRDLKVGDAITITLKDVKNHVYGYTEPKLESNLRGAKTSTETYDIVGIIYYIQESATSIEHSEIYIPACFYPDDFDPSLTTGACSFVLRSPADQAAFLEEAGGQLQEAGFQVEFIDDGWDAFYASSETVLHTTRNSALLLGLMLLLGLLLVAFLYQRARRKEVAILRSLGISRTATLRQAVLPMVFLGLCGVGMGAVAAYSYGMRKAHEAIAAWNAVQTPVVQFHWVEFTAYGAAVWLLLMLLVTVFLLRLCSRPILRLLQGGKAHGKKRRK